jgi:hypothetical protein
LVTERPAQAGLPAVAAPAGWFAALDLSLPYWQGYRQLILRLQDGNSQGAGLPSAAQLQSLLPGPVPNRLGRPVTFVASREIPAVRYEEHIFRTGEVSTRENNWHDLFNALVWARFPRLKAAINALHFQQIHCRQDSRRGALRDALTLFDECGVVVISSNEVALGALAQRDWQRAFRQQAELWGHDIQVVICGHALLEKFLLPYKALTAHALLLRLDARDAAAAWRELPLWLDRQMAASLLAGRWLRSTADLSPLPLMGIPGWWRQSQQDEPFYADRGVFRPPAKGFSPAPVFAAGDYQAMP